MTGEEEERTVFAGARIAFSACSCMQLEFPSPRAAVLPPAHPGRCGLSCACCRFTRVLLVGLPEFNDVGTVRILHQLLKPLQIDLVFAKYHI